MYRQQTKDNSVFNKKFLFCLVFFLFQWRSSCCIVLYSTNPISFTSPPSVTWDEIEFWGVNRFWLIRLHYRLLKYLSKGKKNPHQTPSKSLVTCFNNRSCSVCSRVEYKPQLKSVFQLVTDDYTCRFWHLQYITPGANPTEEYSRHIP